MLSQGEFNQAIRAACNGNQWFEPHTLRYERSYEWLLPYLHGARVLDTGGASPFYSLLFASDLPLCGNTGNYDLASEHVEYAEPFDLVLSMEVVEHIKDTIVSDRATWGGCGAGNYLRLMANALRQGGHLFLTTPNAIGWITLAAWEKGRAPMMYRPHVREYTPDEICQAVRDQGFEIERLETLDVWGTHDFCMSKRWALQDALNIGDPAYRGDDIFLLARKL